MASGARVLISGAVEGIVDEAVLRRLIQEAGALPGPVYGKSGKQHLRQRLEGYNRAARLSPWLVLVDLDRDAACAPLLVNSWLPKPELLMRFRVAVHEVEAWLLADRERVARYVGVAMSRVSRNPEGVDDPKRTLVELARHSRRREIRDDMVPRPGSGRMVGPAYSSRLIEFVQNSWRPKVAARNSDSLCRCRERLRELVRG